MAKSHWTKAEPRGCPLIDLVCFYLDDAAQKVIKNKGAPGIDGITYEQLPNLLRVHGEKIRQKLKNGTYIPAPVRRVDIPKPNGGTRMLGIPTLLDRTIQQAIVMTIGDAFEDQFSDKSYGFREGRNCQQAVQRAQKYIEDGNRWVVEMDLSKFFDRVNHDILMDRVSRVIDDKAILNNQAIPKRRHHGRRAGKSKTGRRTSGIAAQSATVKHHADGLGSRIGNKRTQSCQICR